MAEEYPRNAAWHGDSSAMVVADASLAGLIEEDARQKLCGGQLLLRVRLAGDEIASLKEPPPLFCLAKRIAYLPFLFNEVYEHFKEGLAPRMGQSYEIWFDYNDVALKWQYPLGVLFDVLLGANVPVPLDLTVHFRGCSSTELLPFSGIGDLQRSIMSAFRQAVFLQQGSTAPFGKLPKQQQTQLWDAISSSNLQAYARIQRELLCKNLSACRSMAIRLHLYGPPHAILLHTAPALEDDGSPSTLMQFLLRAIPALLDASQRLVDEVEIISHGVHIPLDTPLYWLALNAAYLDQFVHLSVRMPAELLRGAAGS